MTFSLTSPTSFGLIAQIRSRVFWRSELNRGESTFSGSQEFNSPGTPGTRARSATSHFARAADSSAPSVRLPRTRILGLD